MSRILLAATAMLVIAATAAADVPIGDSNWKNGSGNTLALSAKGTVHGDIKMVGTEGCETGKTRGTPTQDGNNIQKSGVMHVGGEQYRVLGGEMKWKNPSGEWITMQADNAPPDPSDCGINCGGGGYEDAGDTIGSMPGEHSFVMTKRPKKFWVEGGDCVTSLPA